MDADKRRETIQETMKILNEGVKETYQTGNYASYLKAVSRFHNYSARNIVLILAQCPEATLINGFVTWKKEFQRNVKRGESGIRIIAPVTYKRENPDTGEDEPGIGFRVTYVFDASQTEGKDIPDKLIRLTDNDPAIREAIDHIIRTSEIPISFEDMQGKRDGYYNKKDKYIKIDSGMSDTQTFAVLIHELAHSVLHSDPSLKMEKELKEVEAESVAFVVCNHFGIDSSTASFDYIASWSNGKDLNQLKEPLERIQKTSEKLIDDISAVITPREREAAEVTKQFAVAR